MNDMSNMISCKDVVDLIMDYIENSLEPEAVKDFDMHIDGCDCCHAFINTYKRTISLTHQISREDIPDELYSRLSTLLKERKNN
jgi:hypothetical protein